MAESVSTGTYSMECGFCLQRGTSLVDPRTLPCSHSHCFECLTTHFNLYSVLRCPPCKKVYNLTLENLPSANSVKEEAMCCDVCVKRGGDTQPAVVYCATCNKKYCDKHKQHHDDLLEEHPKMDIIEYGAQAKKFEKRTCEAHKDEPYCGGCKTCLAVFCVKCMFGMMGSCTEGSFHDLLPLDELVSFLTKNINELREKLLNKGEKLSDLFKSASAARADYERETTEMVETLRRTCDEQINAIKARYEHLEREFIRLRGQTVERMTCFMEDDVWVQLSNLDNQILRIEASFRDNHKVDIVGGYKGSLTEIQRLSDGEIPVLQIENSVTLNVKEDERREIEVEINTVDDLRVDLKHGLMDSTLPKSIKLLKTVQVSSPCIAVAYSQGRTYAGLWNGTVDIVNNDYRLSKSFIKITNNLRSFTVYNDRVYAVAKGNPDMVQVYDISGQFITDWAHTDNGIGSSSLVVAFDQMIVPDRGNKQLTIYSLTGQIIRHVYCSQIDENWVALCAVDKGSVIMSNYGSSQVSRIDITTGKVMWTCGEIAKPQGVTCYGVKYVLVASQGCDKIRILHVRTGHVLSEVADVVISAGKSVFDLHSSGNTLIVPTSDYKKILYYQLK